MNDYRSPVLSMQRELASLETELAALRENPPAPKASRAEKELAKIEAKVRKARARIFARELTPREVGSLRRTRVVCLFFAAGSPAALFVHLAVLASSPLVWRATTCSFNEMSDSYTAVWTDSKGGARTFHTTDVSKILGRAVSSGPCWVPDPPVDGVGRVDEPSAPEVSAWDRTWPGSSLMALIGFLSGLFGLFLYPREWRKRLANEIPKDRRLGEDD